MPKTIEYSNKGMREVYFRKSCHSCWDCTHCLPTFKSYYACEVRLISAQNNSKFPFDNTICKEYKDRNAES